MHAELVGRIARGGADGRAAETELCRRFATRIRLYGLRHLRDEDRAADLVQIVLVATIEAARAGRIEEPEHLDRFVLGTCRNSALRIRANDARVEARPEIDLGASEMKEPLDLDALFRCIAALEARGRTVLLLTFQEEQSPDAIASSLGTSPGNVRVLRHRAVAQLRACLDGAT
jgi:RNA polymerase sigma-70 factor, ECF subfamily